MKLVTSDGQPIETPALEPAHPDEPTDFKLPPGKCMQCGAAVDRDLLEAHPNPEIKQRNHRRRQNKHDVVGMLCGPVITTWFYRVVLWKDGEPRAIRRAMPLPLEGTNGIELLEDEYTEKVEGAKRAVVLFHQLESML